MSEPKYPYLPDDYTVFTPSTDDLRKPDPRRDHAVRACGHSLSAIEDLMTEIEQRDRTIATLRAELDGWLQVIDLAGDQMLKMEVEIATLRAALDGLIAAVESSSVRPDHLSHQHPQWPQTECDECYAIRREQYDALRAALATAREVTP